MIKETNGTIPLAAVRITLGQFFALLGSCLIIAAGVGALLWRVSVIETKIDAAYPTVAATTKIAQADSIHADHNLRITRLETGYARLYSRHE